MSIAAVLVAAPSTSWACGMCLEHSLKIRAPFHQPLPLLVVLWFLGLLVLHRFVRLPTPK